MSSILKVDQLQDSGGNAILTSDGAGNITTPGITTGKVLQVVSTTKSDTFTASVASTGNVDITGLSVSITPSSTSSKILIMCSTTGSAGSRAFSVTALKRGGSLLDGAVGDAAGSRPRASAYQFAGTDDSNSTGVSSFHYLDTPASTSAQTYQVAFVNTFSSTQTMRVNRTENDTNSYLGTRSISSITAMEIAG